MIIVPIQCACFDDETTLVMELAFDQACGSLRRLASTDKVRELIAKRIVDAAKNGERDPIHHHSQALMGFGINDTSMPVVSVGRTPPVPTTLAVAHAA